MEISINGNDLAKDLADKRLLQPELVGKEVYEANVRKGVAWQILYKHYQQIISKHAQIK